MVYNVDPQAHQEKMAIYDHLFSGVDKIQTGLFMPSITFQDLKEGLKRKVFSRKTAIDAFEFLGFHIPKIQSFCKRNKINADVIRGNILNRRMEKKYDFAFLDFCGHPTSTFALWMYENRQAFVGTLAITFATNIRFNSEFHRSLFPEGGTDWNTSSFLGNVSRRWERYTRKIRGNGKAGWNGIDICAMICELLGVDKSAIKFYYEYAEKKQGTTPMLYLQLDMKGQRSKTTPDCKKILAKAGQHHYKVKPSEWAWHPRNPNTIRKGE